MMNLKPNFTRISSLFLALVLLFGACTKDASFSNNPNLLGTEFSSASNGAVLLPQATGGKYIKDAYIVVLKDDVANVDAEVNHMVKRMGVFAAKKGNVYKNTVKGFSI